MPPPLSSIVASSWPPSRKAQQFAARPWSPCSWSGLGEPARPHKALVVLPALPVPSRPHDTWGGQGLLPLLAAQPLAAPPRSAAVAAHPRSWLPALDRPGSLGGRVSGRGRRDREPHRESPASRTRPGAGQRHCPCRKRPRAPVPEVSAPPTAMATVTITATSRAKATGMAAKLAATTATAAEPATRTFCRGHAGHADRVTALPPPPGRPSFTFSFIFSGEEEQLMW